MALAWIKSSIEGRKQIVQCNAVLSRPHGLEVGSPQGSVLSPVLFLLYIMDFPLWLPDGLRDVGFADDIVVVSKGKDRDSVIKNLESISKITATYLSMNKLQVNENKTALMAVGKKGGSRGKAYFHLGWAIKHSGV